MKELVKAQQLPLIPEDWDYETSVNYVKPKIEQWKKLTYEIAYALYVANEVLLAQGRRTDLVTNVTKLPTFEQYCTEIGITKMTAYRWMAMVFGPKRLPSPLLPKIESQVLYADPPWAFENSGFDQSAEQQYETLKPEKIENYTDETGRQIRQLAKEKASVLFLWTPASILPDALQILRGWGFTFKTHFVWRKDRASGSGWFMKTRHENLLIGVQGNELHPGTKYESVFEAPVTGHSKKPESVYDMIEVMYTGPYIELFARNTREGWESWGNEL